MRRRTHAAALAACLAVCTAPACLTGGGPGGAVGVAPLAAAMKRGGTASRIPGGIPDGAQGADLAFYTLADRYLDDLFRAWPTQATVTGYHRYDDRLDDLTPASLRAKLELALRYRAEFAGVDPDRLSVSARIDHALAKNDVEGTILALDQLKVFERDPQAYVDLLGNATLYLTLLPADSPAWPERLAALLSRMKQIPAFLEAAKRNLVNPPLVITDLVAATHAGNIAFFEQTLPPLFAKAPAIEAALRAENVRALAALRDFQTWVLADLKARSRGDWRLGRDLWTKKLRCTLQSDMLPEEIERRAQEMVDGHRRRMLEVATPLHDRLFPSHRHDETGEARTNVIVREVLDEVSKRHSTRETLFDDTRKAVERARSFIRQKNLVTLPPDDDNLVIEPTPGFMDGVAVAFFNPPPVLEPELKKSFWISSVPKGGSPETDRDNEESFFREYNSYALQGLTIHEAFPGHYVQYWHALRSPLATVYKKIFSSGTFAEGWAVLAERLMFEAGYAADEPENLLVHLKQNLRTPLNAILDARMHTTSMTEAEVDRFALDLMRRLGFQEEAEAKGKLRRAKVTSTQLSTYFVGYVELNDILEEVRKREGRKFDLRAFSDRLLSFGTIPPRYVRDLLN